MSEVNFLQVGSWSQCAHCFMFYCGEHYCGADWQAKPVDFGKELDAAWLANVGKRLGSGPAPVPSGPPEAPRGAEPLPEVAGLPVTGPPDWEALCEEALATSWGANEDCARRLHNALRDAIRASAPSAGAARANELADALDVLATYEVLAPYPAALRYLAEVAALLRSRASAPPDRERLIAALAKADAEDDCPMMIVGRLKGAAHPEALAAVADAVLAAHATPRPEPPA